MSRERVVACLSGGVDSSVAAARLVEQGYEVVGVFMRSGVSGHSVGEKQGCCSVEDALDARRVADLLGIPFYPLDMAEAFEPLIQRFVDDYARGRTPNPCVLCNRWLKFGHVLRFADKLGARWVASGHYARVEERRGRATLLRGRDRRKDQSYVLAVLDQHQLARVRFPLGEADKDEVRAEAAARGLVRVADKRDSQEICFVAGDYRDLLRERLPADALALTPGEIVDPSGEVLGRHPGVAGFTLGQRKGIGVALGEPAYVQRTDVGKRLVVVGPKEGTLRRRIEAEEVTWVGRELTPGEELVGRAQIRAHGATTPARVRALTPETVEVTLEAPVSAVASGQVLVVYGEDDDEVLLSAWISHSE